MIKKLLLGTFIVTILSASTVAFAEDVFVTARGKKYHKEACPFIQNKDTQKISDKQAQEKSLNPCGKCFKEDVSSKSQKLKEEKRSAIEMKTKSI